MADLGIDEIGHPELGAPCSCRHDIDPRSGPPAIRALEREADPAQSEHDDLRTLDLGVLTTDPTPVVSRRRVAGIVDERRDRSSPRISGTR